MEMQQLLKWLEAGGAKVDGIELRSNEFSHGTAVFATRPFLTGEMVFSISTKQVLTMAAAKSHQLVATTISLLQTWNLTVEEPFLMCLRLCAAKGCKDDVFHNYAASLPQQSPGASTWPEHMVSFLKSTSLCKSLETADAEMDRYESIIKRITESDATLLQPPGDFDRNSMQWARGMMQSRQMPGALAGDPNDQCGCMVPLFDVLNHVEGAKVSTRVEGDRVEFVTNESIEAGSQVWSDYGGKSNEELLRCYGFALAGNIRDYVPVTMTLNSGPDGVASMVILTEDGVPQHVIEAIEATNDPTAFVSLLRTLLTQKKTLADCIQRLPSIDADKANADSPEATTRWSYVRVWLVGQLKILDLCLQEMQGGADPNPPRRKRRRVQKPSK